MDIENASPAAVTIICTADAVKEARKDNPIKAKKRRLIKNWETKPDAKAIAGNRSVKRIVFSTNAISAKIPITRLKTDPQVAPSNIPTATHTAGKINGQTPSGRIFVNSIFCVIRATNIYRRYFKMRLI